MGFGDAGICVSCNWGLGSETAQIVLSSWTTKFAMDTKSKLIALLRHHFKNQCSDFKNFEIAAGAVFFEKVLQVPCLSAPTSAARCICACLDAWRSIASKI